MRIWSLSLVLIRCISNVYIYKRYSSYTGRCGGKRKRDNEKYLREKLAVCILMFTLIFDLLWREMIKIISSKSP